VSALGGPVIVDGQSLLIETELGESHQSFLLVDTVPAGAHPANRNVEGLLGMLETLEFPVDVALRPRRLCDDRAITIRRGDVVTQRRLLPPRSCGRIPIGAGVSLCVSAASGSELERRVVRLRRELAGVRLRRPTGEQLVLFHEHLPGWTSTDSGRLGVDRLGAVRLPSPPVGSRAGAYIGHTVSGPPRPVLFDPTEQAGTGNSTATVLTGGRGSGKTLCMELIMYHAFLGGSVVVDVDPRGDHALERLPESAAHVQVLELSASRRFAGLLDPLRIAPRGSREQLACEFLAGLVPEQNEPKAQTKIAAAIRRVAARGGRTCAEVVQELERGEAPERALASSIAESAGSGPAVLVFGRPTDKSPDVGRSQVTSLRVRDLTTPGPGPLSAAADPARTERLIVRLLVAFAIDLTRRHPERHCVVGVDDATALLACSAGQDLLTQLSNHSCSAAFTPLIATGDADDAVWLDERFGAAFSFGARGQAQQTAPGRCLVRDYHGRVDVVQIEFADDRLLPLLDTTPKVPPPVRR
jgi:AAA-like domain